MGSGCIHWLGMKTGKAFWLFFITLTLGSFGVLAQNCLHKGEVLCLPIVSELTLLFPGHIYIQEQSVVTVLWEEISTHHIYIDDKAFSRKLLLDLYRSLQ